MHFYTFLKNLLDRVTQVANLGGGRQIIRVKNCSGSKTVTWTGAWNPDDTRWANLAPGIQRELDAETFHDGGFWLAFGDFLKYFEVRKIRVEASVYRFSHLGHN